ncbi:MAG: methyltransferase [Aquificae bacterium]|nr:methyltransferase [Aquificota bacterium]
MKNNLLKDLRPTSSKVRQALFNILYDVEGLSFLDLFAGTGGVGITALEKGAKPVVFVEKNRKRALEIKKKLGKREGKVIPTDAVKYLKDTQYKFDIIFADPPYNYKQYDKLIDNALNSLSEGGIFILEHRAGKSFGAEEERRYGDTILSFWRR